MSNLSTATTYPMRQKRARVADVVRCLPAARKDSTHERLDFEVGYTLLGWLHLETEVLKLSCSFSLLVLFFLSHKKWENSLGFDWQCYFQCTHLVSSLFLIICGNNVGKSP